MRWNSKIVRIGDSKLSDLGVENETHIAALYVGSQVLGSDGLWDVLEPQSAVDLALDAASPFIFQTFKL